MLSTETDILCMLPQIFSHILISRRCSVVENLNLKRKTAHTINLSKCQREGKGEVAMETLFALMGEIFVMTTESCINCVM